MIECQIPQDILKYKAKFIAGLTARQAVFGFLGIISGLGSYFTILSKIPSQPRLWITAVIVLPFLLFGFIRPLGMSMEKAIAQIVIDNFIAPANRVNETIHPEYEKQLSLLSPKKRENKSKTIKKSKEYKSIK